MLDNPGEPSAYELTAPQLGVADGRVQSTVSYLKGRGLLCPNHDVADIGCGSGAFSVAFAKSARHVTGFDASRKKISQGCAHIKRGGLDNVSLRVCDFQVLDIDKEGLTGKFELVFSSLSPDVYGMAGLEKSMRMSRGYCCSASDICSENKLESQIMREVFGRELPALWSGHWYYSLFNVLFLMGYYPETTHYKRHLERSIKADADSARLLTERLLAPFERTFENEARVLSWLRAHSDSSGLISEVSDIWHGRILWDVRQKNNKPGFWPGKAEEDVSMQSLPTRAQVVETLFNKWHPVFRAETVAVDDALGRVLVNNAFSQVTIPIARASAMDGVGVIASRFENGPPDTSSWKLGEDFCRVGTGDDFSDKFDAVIPIEKAQISKKGTLFVNPEVVVEPGMHIRDRGSTIAKGDLLARKNRRLRSFDLACLVMGGVLRAEVYQRPRVAFIPTGNELIPPGVSPRRGSYIDSNSTLAKHMLLEMGAEPICFTITPDDESALSKALDSALKCADIVIINGGSSKGSEDYSARLLKESGSALFHWVAAAPGKPMCVAVIENKPVINMPGPPVAVLYGMDWCIRAAVNRLLRLPTPKRQKIKGVLTEEIRAPRDTETLCMMDVHKSPSGYDIKQKPRRGGNTAQSLGAGAIYITKLGLNGHCAGEMLDVDLLRGEEDFSF